MKQIIAIIATGLLFFTIGQVLLVQDAMSHPIHAALWGAVGTAALLYWPRRSTMQLLSLCWLCILLYGIALMMLVGCAEVRDPEAYMPGAGSMLIFISIPFLMVLLPIGVLFVRTAYRDHMRTVLEEAVLAATDPQNGPTNGAREKALRLLAEGISADYIPDAMVERDELVFEAVETPHPQAVANAVELLPHLAKAGAHITQASLDTAKYNSPPAIQAELQKFPITP